VLLVDDEASIREATKQMPEANSYRVVTTANGGDALRMSVQTRNTVQLVLTDMMMPMMDGGHLIKSLRILEPMVKVVAMSGLDQEFREGELEALAVCEFVTKPFDAAELLRAVHNALNGTSAHVATLGRKVLLLVNGVSRPHRVLN
jgi:two-component system, cell cycle sensor histidine kinase and response regulator CckA